MDLFLFFFQDLLSFLDISQEFLNLLDDMDAILGTNSNFLLGKVWLNPAKNIPGKLNY